MVYQDRVLEHLVEEGTLQSASVRKLRDDYGDVAAAALISSELMEEESVLRALAIAYDCVPAGYREGLFIDRSLFRRVEPAVLLEHRALPVRRRRSEIDVVVVEPLGEDAEATLEEALGAPINQYIWPALRFLQARHVFFGEPLPLWSNAYLRAHPVALGFASSDGVDVHEALKNSDPLQVDQWDEADLWDFVENCFDRDTLLKVLLGYAAQWLTHRLILVVGRGGVQPYFMEDWPELLDRFDDVMALRSAEIGPGAQTVLADSDELLAGSPEDLSLTPVFEGLHAELPPVVVTVPVRIAGRTAMALMGVPTDPVASIRLEEISDGFDGTALSKAAERIGDQLQEMIRRAKQDILPPPAQRIPPLPKPRIRLGLGMEESLVEERIARRTGTERHRWEIVDISQVLEEQPTPEMTSAVASALSSQSEASVPPEPSVPSEPSESEITLDPGATTFGMPALQDSSFGDFITGQGSGSDSESEAMPEEYFGGEESSEAEVPDEPSEAEVPEESPEDHDAQEEAEDEDEKDVDSGWTGILSYGKKKRPDELKPRPKKSNFRFPQVTGSLRKRDMLPPDEEEAEPSDVEEPVVEEPVVEEPEVKEEGLVFESAGTTSLGGFSMADVAEEAPRATRRLVIPTDASGVPMAQIFRRPPSVRKALTEKRASQEEMSVAESGFDRDESITGRTMLGTGAAAMSSLLRKEAPPESSEATDLGDSSSWLDEAEEPPDDARPGGTVRMGPSTGQTQGFGQLLDDMESSGRGFDEVSSPKTIPVEALESLSNSGIAIEILENLELLDSRDPGIAFKAAQYLSRAGVAVMEELAERFPGRLYVDRYQFTVTNMPPVSEHGPVLETLVRIGAPSLSLVEQFLDDTSLDARFYATYLLTELPAEDVLDSLFERLFDRDQQTRTLAQDIAFSHRHFEGFKTSILEPLREVVRENDDELRLEVAAESLRRLKDLPSVPLLIDAMDGHPDRVLRTIHRALQEITFQPLQPSTPDWKQWWDTAQEQPRWQWLVDAMNSGDEEIRLMAFDEIDQLPGLKINYHPNQPSKLRQRAQQELSQFFEAQSG